MVLRTVLTCAAVVFLTPSAEDAAAAPWQPAPSPLMTPWAEGLTPENAWREYPRPQMVRQTWTNLNGLWELPIGKGRTYLADASGALDAVVGGWQVNTVFTWQSGLPFTPSYRDCNADRDTGWCRPDLVGDLLVSPRQESAASRRPAFPRSRLHGPRHRGRAVPRRLAQ